jgi:hypothetical protein
MENLEQRCLEKLNKILSKFNLKIEIFHNVSRNVWQYILIDNYSTKDTYSNRLCLWSSISDMLIPNKHRNSIFECLNLYSYRRYLEAYNAIKYLENICCLEEFIFKCDLIGI